MQSQMTGFTSKTILVEFSRHFKPASFEPKTQTVKLASAWCRSGTSYLKSQDAVDATSVNQLKNRLDKFWRRSIWALKAWLNQLIIHNMYK